ncbi:MAG: acyltransferase domain-containing protein [Deltaproteobacteria bacterium]|nr:acyltransferase domain-containing protein [Deltaproteobacteria bacterium]
MSDAKSKALQDALSALMAMKATLDDYENRANEPIAIVGFGCRFPGRAATPQGFWELLRDGADAITDIPRERFDLERYYSADAHAPGKMYTRRGGFLERLPDFDAEFFGLSPLEVERMDPQQRLVLEVAWEALEHAGLPIDRLAGSRTGVFVGASAQDFFSLVSRAGLVDAYTGTGTNLSIIAARLSFLLGLQGPSLTVDTACSSSLVALHLALQSLRSGECELALACGVSVMLTPEAFIGGSKARMLSPDDLCRTFDANASGYVRGEGCGVVALKRYSAALRDGDIVHALVLGSAVNHNGRSSALKAFNGPAQQAVVQAALDASGVGGDAVQYVEAQGTGTPLGDPIEIEALSAVLGKARSMDDPFLLGSVKTNLGHLEAASGMAGLLKVVLALANSTIPRNLNLDRLNPHINWERTPAVVPTVSQPWERGERARLAGLSAFSFGGANAHVVIKEPPAPPAQERHERPCDVLTLSAKNDAALDDLVGRYVDRLTNEPGLHLVDVCWTANVCRTHHPIRLAVVADTVQELLQSLTTRSHAPTTARPRVFRSKGARDPCKVAFLFCGQGSQYAGMGKALYATEPTFRASLDRCARELDGGLDRPLLDVIFQEGKLLDQPAYAQPAIFALQYALAELWRSWGVHPSYVLGHSVGEYAAACHAGLLEFEQTLRLVAERGRLLQSVPDQGAAAAVSASEERVGEWIKARAGESDVVLAASNAPERVLVTGSRAGVQALVDAFVERGVEAKVLSTVGAAHSPFVEPILREFEQAGAGLRHAPLRMGMISTLYGRLATQTELSEKRYWSDQLRRPVRFLDAMRAAKNLGCNTFIEIGPRQALLRLGEACLEPSDSLWLASLSHEQHDWSQMMQSAAHLHAQGGVVNWSAVMRGRGASRVVLPTYPFQRKRHWLAAALPEASPVRRLDSSLLGSRLALSGTDIVFESYLSASVTPWVGDHRLFGEVLIAGAVHVVRLLAAGAAVFPDSAIELDSVLFESPLLLPDEQSGFRSQVVVGARHEKRCSMSISSASEDASAPNEWTRNVTAFASALGSVPAPAASSPVAEGARELSGADFYRDLDRLGHNMGPSFRWVASVREASHEAWAELRGDPRVSDSVSSPIVPPGLLDSCLQIVVHLAPAEAKADERAVFVPFAIDRLRWFPRPAGGVGQSASPALRCHVRLRPITDRKERTADIRVHADADVLFELDGVQARLMPHEALLRGAKRARAPEPTRMTTQRSDDVVAKIRAHPSEQRQLLTEFVVSSVRTLLCLQPDEKLDSGRRLTELGLDSILAIDLVRFLQQALQLSLPLTLLLQLPTIDALVTFLDENMDIDRTRA